MAEIPPNDAQAEGACARRAVSVMEEGRNHAAVIFGDEKTISPADVSGLCGLLRIFSMRLLIGIGPPSASYAVEYHEWLRISGLSAQDWAKHAEHIMTATGVGPDLLLEAGGISCLNSSLLKDIPV